MDGKDLLHSRGKALESAFFARVDQQLLEQLRNKLEHESRREALQEATGIQDPEVLDHLAKIGATPETLIAVTMIPVIEVAWADGKLDEKEVAAILDVAHEEGLDEKAPGRALLNQWLSSPPDKQLYEAWYLYIEAIREQLSKPELHELRDGILKHVEWVAKSSGATLGLNAISTSQKKIIERIKDAFKN